MTKWDAASCETEREQAWWGNGWVWGLVLLVLVLGGCAEWTIPPCEGTDFQTPCVGPCKIAMDGQAQTLRTVPYSVVIRDHDGTLHCQEIKP